MTTYRQRLPQLGRQIFLTDGGLETTLIFHQGLDLPYFAAFDLIRTRDGRATLGAYLDPYLGAAKRGGYGFILDSCTWRASPDWGAKLGYSREALMMANQEAIGLLVETRDAQSSPDFPMVVSGAVGPRGDGYVASELMTETEAERYHEWQIGVLADTPADMVAAYTMTNIPEAIGIARAARRHGIPSVISFTLETDGRLPAGDTLMEAITKVDAATDAAPAYYMINCAHPDHFTSVLDDGGPWLQRLRGVRANASRRSHAELNEAPDLDAGDPDELGRQYRDLIARFPQFTVLGGCCGTDDRHVACIGHACRPTQAAA
jgi:homocysteine S-methyltransferase